MYRTYGSLALQPENAPVRRTERIRPVAVPVSSPAYVHREPLPAAPLCAGEALLRRRFSAQRLRNIVLTVVVILGVGASCVYILYHQSLVMKASYDVAATERLIAQLGADTQVVEEKISACTDLAEIRTLAISRLGMQDPAVQQRITIEMPLSDRMLLSNGKASGTSADEADEDASLLRSATADLEGFFRTLR